MEATTMSDEQKPVCRSCGAELTGKDVYEGMCKSCREEAILGAPPQKHAETRPRPRRREEKPLVEHPQGVIALETEVDVEADTRELAVEREAGGGDSPALAPERPAEAASTKDEAPPRLGDISLIPEVPGEPLTLKVSEKTTPEAPQQPAVSPDNDSAVESLEPTETPTPEPKGLRAEPEAAVAEAQAPAATGGPRAEGPGEAAPQPQAAEEAEGPELAFDLEDHLAQLRPLLVELSAEVRSLREMLERGERPPLRPLRFGFKAFFGFLLALGLAALAALGLTALVGVVFYPPALESLRGILQWLGVG